MSASQVTFTLCMALLFMCFVLVYVNILIAKRALQEDWKRYTGWEFAHSLVAVAIRERAAMWMSRFGYSEAQAMLLSTQQLIAMVEVIAAMIFVGIVISSLSTH